jgi:phytoene dehydrogenase-like protein
MKVLIAEQHYKPGGYCTSFQRKGYTFDAAAHSFGGFRPEGAVRQMFKDLALDERIAIHRHEPSDIIITPDFSVAFWSETERTISEFHKAFPAEKAAITSFFHLLKLPTPQFYTRVRSWTFRQLLDAYFLDEQLKSVLAYPIYGNGALPPSRMSAFIGAKIYQEFLLDGGYYPENNMQALPNALASRFEEFGGSLRLSSRVEKICIENDSVSGVVIAGECFIPSRYVISNCDARQTIVMLIGKEGLLENDYYQTMSTLAPSLSIFVAYIGVQGILEKEHHPGTNVWMLSDYAIESYLSQKDFNLNNTCTMTRVMPNQSSILAFANAPYYDKIFWDAHKEQCLNSFIARIEEYAIPKLAERIAYKGAATPHTLSRYTSNYHGAAYGWACTPEQLGLYDLRKPPIVHNLFLAGHWVTEGIGIPGVTYVGRDTANMILRKERRQPMRSVLY